METHTGPHVGFGGGLFEGEGRNKIGKGRGFWVLFCFVFFPNQILELLKVFRVNYTDLKDPPIPIF